MARSVLRSTLLPHRQKRLRNGKIVFDADQQSGSQQGADDGDAAKGFCGTHKLTSFADIVICIIHRRRPSVISFLIFFE